MNPNWIENMNSCKLYLGVQLRSDVNIHTVFLLLSKLLTGTYIIFTPFKIKMSGFSFWRQSRALLTSLKLSKKLLFQICLHNQMSHLFTSFLFQTCKGVSKLSLFRQMEYSYDSIPIATTAAPGNQCSVDFHTTREVTEACKIFFIPTSVLFDLIQFNIWFDPYPSKYCQQWEGHYHVHLLKGNKQKKNGWIFNSGEFKCMGFF